MTMKRIIIVLLFIALPMSMFAQFYLGPTAMYKGDPMDLPGTTPDYSLIDHLAFGADVKLQISLFEVQALAMYNFNNTFNVYLDAGIALDLAIVTIGAGIGPNFYVSLDDVPDPVGFGFNGKVHVDLNLGGVKISAYYMFLIDNITVSNIESQMYAGNVGLSLLFKLM
jgi:hypothetical protein